MNKTLYDWARTYCSTDVDDRPCHDCGRKGGIRRDVQDRDNYRWHRCHFACRHCGAQFHSDWQNNRLIGVGREAGQ